MDGFVLQVNIAMGVVPKWMTPWYSSSEIEICGDRSKLVKALKGSLP
jgi:hypothetical protein